MQQYTIAARPCFKCTYSETMELVIEFVQYMYKIIYQHNIEKGNFHSLKNNMFKNSEYDQEIHQSKTADKPMAS